MKGILGKKLGMTQVFSPEGNVIPVTVIEAGPCVVLQKKDLENDGYEAVQLGFSDKKEKNATKPEIGHAKKRVPHLSATFAKFAESISPNTRLAKK
ncbi:hypothetical protein PACILC2_29680 [Paenibacillus cisolokensis]|uniref:50S ribosomal protein L3 n=1 Tax=Paenibacillus cisolokensis TaxID=1658519 RepID=A0ABQ4N8B3_9BACL|nr:hypothetical protein PACILC2_29680 [Paenibacillus cisolokensis]